MTATIIELAFAMSTSFLPFVLHYGRSKTLGNAMVYILMSGPIINGAVTVVFLVDKILAWLKKKKTEEETLFEEDVNHKPEMDEKNEKEEVKCPEDNIYGGLGAVDF